MHTLLARYIMIVFEFHTGSESLQLIVLTNIFILICNIMLMDWNLHFGLFVNRLGTIKIINVMVAGWEINQGGNCETRVEKWYLMNLKHNYEF